MDVDIPSTISTLATIRLHSKSRLLESACCPDKDLVVLVSNDGTAEKMSLWKVQGSKKWEVDVSKGENGHQITALCWSPDGQTIVVTHHPPRVSLHSVQNGHEERSLSISTSTSASLSPPRLTGVWWYKAHKKAETGVIPDIFRRENVVTGSAHSILRLLPLLDPLPDESLPLTTTEMFAFQGTQTRPSPRTASVPDSIAKWPALPPDLIAASIKANATSGDDESGEQLDEKDMTHVDSLLVTIDNAGYVHAFLDGSYPLGAFEVHPTCAATRVMRFNDEDRLFVHARISSADGAPVHSLVPLVVRLPLLAEKATRRIAESSSSAKELVWYTMRVVREMRKVWFGEDGQDGAREMNSNWVKGLEERQIKFDQEANAIFDLTRALVTGKASDALVDYYSSSEQTSERGLAKWESTVSEALKKLREFAENRVAPACQRLHLVLEEVKGWSQLPQIYGHFGFIASEIDECLDLAARSIVIASWLAAAVRRELARFKEWMSFIHAETTRYNHNQPDSFIRSAPRSIDKWFIGPVPQFSVQQLTGVPQANSSLRSVLDQARRTAEDPSKLRWPPITKKRDLSHLDRNLDALVHALADKCQQVFDRAARAVARTAILDQGWYRPDEQAAPATDKRRQRDSQLPDLLYRVRTTCDDRPGQLTEHLAVRLPKLQECDLLCMIRATYQHAGDSRTTFVVGFAVLECKFGREQDGTCSEAENFKVVDMEFFDEQSMIIVFEGCTEEGRGVIVMMDYAELGYLAMDSSGYVSGPSREDIVEEVIGRAVAGEVVRTRPQIRKQRELQISRGAVRLSVNGRAGRRTVCVLGGEGMELETLDMEGEEAEEEEEQGA